MSSGPYVIVLGNEKGGTGKSTTAMHIMAGLMKLGYTVGSLDIDARQGTLTRYVENRRRFIESNELELPMPEHIPLYNSRAPSLIESEAEDKAKVEEAMKKMQGLDFVVVDTPGHDTYLSRMAHSYADTLITPINDSFIDLDVIVQLDSISKNMVKPSTYAEWVWEQKKRRAIRDGKTIDWIVMRNRLSTIHAKNKEDMWQVLMLLSKRIGFRLMAGFSERVIFRELFLSGLTLLDMREVGRTLSLSHISAKQELRLLLESLNLPPVNEKIAENF